MAGKSRTGEVDGKNHKERKGDIAVSTSSYFIVLNVDDIQPGLCAINITLPLFHTEVYNRRQLREVDCQWPGYYGR